MKMSQYVSLAEAAEIAGCHVNTIAARCRQGRIAGAYKTTGKGKPWAIPADFAITGPHCIPDGYVSSAKAARMAGCSVAVIESRCRQGRIAGAYKTTGKGKPWAIPADFAITGPHCIPDGYVSAHEIAGRLRLARGYFMKLCNAGKVPGAKKIGITWYVRRRRG